MPIVTEQEGEMHCRLQSPEGVLFDGEAKIVVARSPEGEFAVMEGHAPLLAALGPSPLRVKAEDGERAFALRGGVLQVTEDGVSVLAHEAIPAQEIDVAAVIADIEGLTNGELQEGSSRDEEIAFLSVQREMGGERE